MPFQLHTGDVAPVQQTATTCGSASLTVARMLANPAFAGWVARGEGAPPGAVDPGSEAARFAAYEQVVMARTNGLVGAGRRLNVPWPRRFGTSPLGALRELEHGAARGGVRYRLAVVRHRSAQELRSTYRELVDVVGDGLPALLYVGNAALPRHVVLALPGDGDEVLDVYDPATGRVSELEESAFAERQIGLAGWDVPWLALWPKPDAGSALRQQPARRRSP